MDIQYIQNNRIMLLLWYSPLFYIYDNVQVSLCHCLRTQHKFFIVTMLITNLTIHSTWSKHAYINFFWHFHGCLLLSVKFQFINFLLLYYYISKSLTIKFILLTSIKIELFANFQFMKFFFYYCNTENLYQQLHPFFKLFFKIKSRYHLWNLLTFHGKFTEIYGKNPFLRKNQWFLSTMCMILIQCKKHWLYRINSNYIYAVQHLYKDMIIYFFVSFEGIR